jgi:uncharacterized caspase-like protein
MRRLISASLRVAWMLALALAASASLAEERVALVIGNAAYKDQPLDNPVNDATDVAGALREAGFRVILKRDIDSRAMRQAVREFAAELRRADVGLFYFAGHGVQIAGSNYLLPVAADIRSEADAEDLSLSVDYVLRTMEESNTGVRIVILDACRNNPFPRSFRSSARGLAPVNATTGSLVAFATAPGSLAADGSGRNGIYSKHLLASLAESDSEILRVFQRTRAAVVRETGGRQTPWESTSLLGEFHFRSRGLVVAAPTMQQAATTQPAPMTPQASTAAPVAPAAQTATVAAADPGANERVFWESVKDTRNPAELRAYLDQFPRGTFAPLAQARLRGLETNAPAAPATGAPAPVAATSPAAAGETSRAPGGVAASPLSYGTVTSQVQKNRTTQLELLQLFGGPSISTMDAEGSEVWVYERSVTETEQRSQGEGWQAAAKLGLFFAHAQMGGGGGGGRSSSSTGTTTSFRSLTVIVKFNPDKTVRDYSVRASQF